MALSGKEPMWAASCAAPWRRSSRCAVVGVDGEQMCRRVSSTTLISLDSVLSRFCPPENT